MKRLGMVIDLKKCIGCHTCSIACKVKNGTPPGIFYNLVIDQEVGNYPNVRRQFIPRPCMHCEHAPCVDVCPTGASYQRADGLVLIEEKKCMGCRQCLLACPYGARSLNQSKAGYFKSGLTPTEEILYKDRQLGIVEKCNFCVNEVEQGGEPACITACPFQARIFGDLNDPASEVAQLIHSRQSFRLLKELGTEPAVYYLPL